MAAAGLWYALNEGFFLFLAPHVYRRARRWGSTTRKSESDLLVFLITLKNKHFGHLRLIGKSCVSTSVNTWIFFYIRNELWVYDELNRFGVVGVFDPIEIP